MAKYEIEVWDKTGGLLGNIRPICSNLQWTTTLNDAESLSFDVDADLLDKLISTIGYDKNPLSFMECGRTDLRVKRNGKYLFGANLISMAYSGDSNGTKKSFTATGYLNYYKYRYITANYSQQYQEDILFDVINKCNAVDGGDYGITRGIVLGGKKVKRDRTYTEKEVKSLFQQMSEVVNGPDFEFTADKKLNIYETLGVYRPSIILTFPGNIISYSFTRSVDNVASMIRAKGSGNGDDAIQINVLDQQAADYAYLREKTVNYNSVVNLPTLQQNAMGVLNAIKQPFEVPSLNIQNDVLDLSSVKVGDTVVVDMTASKDLMRISGNYRIQQISCSVDQNDSEAVSVAFDNLDIQSIIDKQEPEETK